MKTEPTELNKKEPVLAVNHMVDWTDEGKSVTTDACYKWLKIAFKEGQSSPKIKQLEWGGEVAHRIKANTSIGEYEVYKSIHGDYLFYIDDIEATTITFNSLEKAKAFAQKDFEARVKECLIIE